MNAKCQGQSSRHVNHGQHIFLPWIWPIACLTATHSLRLTPNHSCDSLPLTDSSACGTAFPRTFGASNGARRLIIRRLTLIDVLIDRETIRSKVSDRFTIDRLNLSSLVALALARALLVALAVAVLRWPLAWRWLSAWHVPLLSWSLPLLSWPSPCL